MRALAGAVLLLAGAFPAAGGGTLTWIETPEGLARGRTDRMATTGRGRLFLAPRITALGGPQTQEGPVQVWAMAVARDGSVYLGTGPEGQILRIGGSGEPRVHFTVDEPMVTALAIAADGALLAAAAPGGAVYRVRPDGSGEAWAVTEERYVWALAVGADGTVYAGTGERGRILAIDPLGAVEILYDSDEPHVVRLLPLGDGGLLAGGAGRGLVYRIDGEGHALVLHDDDLPEVAALAPGADGSVVAALIAPPPPASKRPALRLRLPDGVQVGTTDEAVGMLEESTGPTLRGTIEGLLPEAERGAERTRGRVVRIAADGSVAELWSSPSESPFCLAHDDRGRVLFGTGEPARLYRVEPDGDVARLVTLPEAQLTGLLSLGEVVVVSTSNPAAAYRVESTRAESGSYLSRPFDAGGPARWGSIRWSIARPSGRTEIYTRTGNSREPDDTWSAWSPVLTDSTGSEIVNPDGRFLQWRVRQIGSPDPETSVERLAVRYVPYNRPPRIDSFRTGSPRGSSRTFHLSTGDPDGDALELRLEYRPTGAPGWAMAAVVQLPGAGENGGDPGEREVVWETAAIPEGEYEVRAVVSDQPANPAGEGLREVHPAAQRVVVDRSPPRLEVRMVVGGAALVGLQDGLSDIGRLEVVAGGRTLFTARSEDGVCDSRRESFRIELPEGNGGDWLLRGVDAAGNIVEHPVPRSAGSN